MTISNDEQAYETLQTVIEYLCGADGIPSSRYGSLAVTASEEAQLWIMKDMATKELSKKDNAQ